MHRRIWAILAVLALVGIVSAPANAQPAKTGKPAPKKGAVHMQHALWEVQHASQQLNKSTFSFQNHKQLALAAIQDAANQIGQGLQSVGQPVTAKPTKRDLKDKTSKTFPHLHHALHALEHAKKQLKEAKHDFNGHRQAALRDVDRALQQVRILLKASKNG